MSKLIIESTPDTPYVLLDKNSGKFEIKGSSLPSNIFDFYKPILEWFKEYTREPNHETHLELTFDYLNSSSTKMIHNIISLLEIIQNNGMKVGVIWFYEFGDLEMKEMGEDFAMACKVPFRFVNCNEE
jgi:hypothetical protein